MSHVANWTSPRSQLGMDIRHAVEYRYSIPMSSASLSLLKWKQCEEQLGPETTATPTKGTERWKMFQRARRIFRLNESSRSAPRSWFNSSHGRLAALLKQRFHPPYSSIFYIFPLSANLSYTCLPLRNGPKKRENRITIKKKATTLQATLLSLFPLDFSRVIDRYEIDFSRFISFLFDFLSFFPAMYLF